jgi:hypothetical protein
MLQLFETISLEILNWKCWSVTKEYLLLIGKFDNIFMDGALVSGEIISDMLDVKNTIEVINRVMSLLLELESNYYRLL